MAVETAGDANGPYGEMRIEFVCAELGRKVVLTQKWLLIRDWKQDADEEKETSGTGSLLEKRLFLLLCGTLGEGTYLTLTAATSGSGPFCADTFSVPHTSTRCNARLAPYLPFLRGAYLVVSTRAIQLLSLQCVD